MRLLRAVFVLGLAAAAAGAQAAPKPNAIRVTIDGKTQIVRTLGQPTDTDFYAPLTKQLRSLWLDVKPNDLGDIDVSYRGERVARWPVVTSVTRLPEDPSRPTVLRQGAELLVPIRAVVALGHGWVDWDTGTRTLTITPTVREIQIKEGERGLEVRIEASAPVKVTSLQVGNPPRLAIDFTPAWFKVEAPPAPAGMVRGVRLGQFTKETARITLEVAALPVQVTGIPQSGTSITASVRSAPEGVKIARGPDSATSRATSRPSARPSRSVKPLNPRLAQRRRALASRGGFVRRDPSLLLDATEAALAGKVICIDPGHGGWKVGAAGQNGLREQDACLGMGLQLARALREAGATVLMTRETDIHVSLEERWGFANEQQAHLFISIHCNSNPRLNSQSGTETYYCTPQSLELARVLHPEVVGVMGGRDGGIRRRNFAVVRHTTMPSVLLEVGYINHRGDEAKLGDPAFHETFGSAVRDGLIRYFSGG